MSMSRQTLARRRARPVDQPTTRRVAIYLRRSTDEDHQPFSLEAQETKLRAFVASQPGEWQIVALYSDDASGATLDRPDLQKALRAARAGLFDTLLVYRVDRFSRSLRDLTTLLDDLADAEVVFRSATEPFDTSTPVGRMLVQMLGVFAEFERETIIDRVVAGMERKASKGLWTGGARPLGYRLDRRLDRLVPDEQEVTVVRQIFELYTTHRLGTRSIATKLNDQGLRTRTGRPWSQHTVELILTNRVYLGEKRFRDIVVADAHTPLISAEQFDAAQRILAKRSAAMGQRAANPSEYALTGLIRCPRCGRNFIGTAAHGRHRRYRYYICWSRARYGTKAGCDIYRFNADDLDAAVAKALLDFYTNDTELITRAVGEYRTAHQATIAEQQEQLAAVTRELKDANARIDRYLHAFERGAFDDTDERIRERLASLKDQIKKLRTRKAQLEFEIDQPPQAPSPEQLAKIRNHVHDVLTRGAPSARKALFEALIHEIKVNSDEALTPYFKIPLAENDQKPVLPAPAVNGNRTNQMVRTPPTMVGGTGIEPVTSSV
jgi:site-specific DNA recombinase